MKIIFSVLFFVILVSNTYGQNPYQRINTNPWYPGGVKVDAEFYPPQRDTTWQPSRPGAITKRPQDSITNIIYTWSGVRWMPLSDGKVITLPIGTTSYTFAANTFMEKIVMINAGYRYDIDQAFVSLTPEGTGHVGGYMSFNDQDDTLIIGDAYFVSETIVYFTDITETTVIKIYFK